MWITKSRFKNKVLTYFSFSLQNNGFKFTKSWFHTYLLWNTHGSFTWIYFRERKILILIPFPMSLSWKKNGKLQQVACAGSQQRERDSAHHHLGRIEIICCICGVLLTESTKASQYKVQNIRQFISIITSYFFMIKFALKRTLTSEDKCKYQDSNIDTNESLDLYFHGYVLSSVSLEYFYSFFIGQYSFPLKSPPQILVTWNMNKWFHARF